MKNLNSILLFAVLAVAVVLLWRSCSRSEIPVNSKVDTLIREIEHRDTLLIERDSVVYRTERIRETVKEYRLTSDTITKLILCDSLAVACDSLAVQFSRQDSLYREQIVDYKAIVSLQDSIIKAKPKRRWVIVPVPIPFRRR